MTTALSADFLVAYARLPKKAQKKVGDFIGKFKENPKAAAIHYEPIQRATDRQLRSVRIGDDYRAIVREPERGDHFLLLWVDHHDEAYRWAAGKRTDIHPSTGTLQIYDVVAAEAVKETVSALRAEAPPSTSHTLFSRFSDAELVSGGVPSVLLPAVRAVYTEGDLDQLSPHLPEEASEVLYGLASGMTLDEAITEALDKPPESAPEVRIDVQDVAAALARAGTQRRFRPLEEIDLESALQHPLAVWRVFLHPKQRALVEVKARGPMRITGAAGTGKTVVAMHRAAHLVTKVFVAPADRVLFTTFTRNLAADIGSQLGTLLDEQQRSRVEVINLDAWATRFLKEVGEPVRLATNEDQQKAWDRVLDVYGEDGFSRDLYLAEWRDVVQDQDLRSEEDYVFAKRRQRGTPLPRAERRKLWPAFTAYRDELEERGLTEAVDIYRLAEKAVRERSTARPSAPPPYRAVVVDETQDFPPAALRLVRSLAPLGDDDLFLVGDAHQRIYGRPAPLSHAGIEARGRRSRILKVNYRTTEAISRFALRALEDHELDDLDEGPTTVRGYHSLRPGAEPTVRHFEDRREETDFIVETVREELAAGRQPEEICIAARTGDLVETNYARALQRAGIPHAILRQQEPAGGVVRLGTMHRIKGLEYPVVIVAAVNEGVVPLRSVPELSSQDPVVRLFAERAERCLLYVATTRARDRLVVTSYGTRSRLLPGERAKHAPPRQSQRPAPPPELGKPMAVVAEEAPPSTQRTPSRDEVAPARESAEAGPATRLDARPLELAAPPEPAAAPVPRTATEPPAAPSPAPTEDVASPLDAPIHRLFLPTRMNNWAERRAVETVRDLLGWSREALATEKNLGRTSIADTKARVEAFLGMSWDAARELAQPASTREASEAPASVRVPMRWSELAAWLPAAVALVPPDELPLPTRLLHHCEREGIRTLAALVAISADALIDARNVGRGSVRGGCEVIVDFVENREREEALWRDGFLKGWTNQMKDWEPIRRMVVARRSGLSGDPETLEEIGSSLGVSRERVRQLESACLSRLKSQARWLRFLHERFRAACADGVVRLDALEADPWWSGVANASRAVGYFAERVLDGGFAVLGTNDDPLLGAVRQDDLDQVHAAIQEALAKQPLPCPLSSIRAIVADAAAHLGANTIELVWQDTLEQLTLDQPDTVAAPATSDAYGPHDAAAESAAHSATEQPEPLVLGLGQGRAADVLALLRTSPTPVSIHMIFDRFGRVRLPDEVLYFKQGLVGLEQHFPDFARWRTELTPSIESLMKEEDAARQWHARELLEQLRDERPDLPDWLGPWHLVAIARRSPDRLTYLGRQRMKLATDEADDDRRLHIAELLVDVLQKAGHPIDLDQLRAEAEKRSSVTDLSFNLMTLRPPFVRVTAARVGLVERDLPGGREALLRALELVHTWMSARDEGATAHECTVHLASEAPTPFGSWTHEMTLSVLRADRRFRLTRSGTVGLSEWETARAPTRQQIVRACVEEHGPGVPVETVQQAIEARYGERSAHNAVLSMLSVARGQLTSA